MSNYAHKMDKEAAFEKSASWEDVRAKAQAIVTYGGVEIYRDDAQEVGAYVMSGVVDGLFPVTDGGPYEVILSKRSWENEKNVGGWVQAFFCDCVWGQYHSGRPGGGYSGRFCFEPDSMVLMADGSFKPISEIKAGDVVQSKNGAERVLNVFENDYDGDMVELGFTGSCFNVRMTADHNVLCNDELDVWLGSHAKSGIVNPPSRGYKLLHDLHAWSGFKQACEFKADDMVLFGGLTENETTDVIDFVDEFGERIYEENGKVYWAWKRPGDDSRGGRWHTFSPIDRRIKFDADFAYVLGWYLAEGSIEGHNKKDTGEKANTIVRWTLNENERDVADKIIAILESWGCEGAAVYDYSYRGALALKVSSRPLAELFIKFCGEKSKGKRLERRVMLADKNWQSAFLDAYWQGDGTRKGGCRCIYTANEYLARQVNQIVQRVYGIDSSVHKNANTQGPTYRSKDYSAEERLSSGLVVYHIDYGGDYVQRRYAVDDMHTAHKINSIKMYHKKGKVWNIEVENEHMYCVEGLLVHNCSHAMAALMVANARARSDFMGDRTAAAKGLYNKDNFYEGTKATWVPCNAPEAEPDFVSDSGSMYWHYPEGVVRGADHWGNNIGDCNWHMLGDEHYSAWFDDNDVRYGFCPWQGFESNLEDDMGKTAKSEYTRSEYDDGCYGIVYDDATFEVFDGDGNMLFDDEGEEYRSPLDAWTDMDEWAGMWGITKMESKTAKSAGWERQDDYYWTQYGEYVGYAYADGTWMIIAPDGSIADGSKADGYYDAAMEDCDFAAEQRRLSMRTAAEWVKDENPNIDEWKKTYDDGTRGLIYVYDGTYMVDFWPSDGSSLRTFECDDFVTAQALCDDIHMKLEVDPDYTSDYLKLYTHSLASREEGKMAKTKTAMQPTTFEPGSTEYKVLEQLADALAEQCPSCDFQVKTIYFDYGQDWKWTTIVAYKDGDSWQALNPAEWQYALETGDLGTVVDEVLHGDYGSLFAKKGHLGGAEERLGNRMSALDYGKIHKMVDFGVDLHKNQFKNWQSLFDVQNDEDVQYYKDGLDMVDEDWQEGCRRIWEEISMTASKVAYPYIYIGHGSDGYTLELGDDEAHVYSPPIYVDQYDLPEGLGFGDSIEVGYDDLEEYGIEIGQEPDYWALIELANAANDREAKIAWVDDGMWEEDLEGVWKNISEWDVFCGAVPVDLGSDMGIIWNWSVMQASTNYILAEGRAWSKEEAMSLCDAEVQKYIDSIPLGLDEDDIDDIYIMINGSKTAQVGEWNIDNALGFANIEFGDGCSGEAYLEGDWFLSVGDKVMESGIEHSLEEAMAACEFEHDVNCPNIEASREVEAAEHKIYDEWEDFGNSCWGKQVWDIWTPQGSSSVVQTPLFTCNVQPLDDMTWEVMVDGSQQFAGKSFYEEGFVSPEDAMTWADDKIRQELLVDDELNAYVAGAKLSSKRYRGAKTKRAELYELVDLFDDNRFLEGKTFVDDEGMWHWEIQDPEGYLATSDDMAGVPACDSEDEAFDDMINYGDVRLASRKTAFADTYVDLIYIGGEMYSAETHVEDSEYGVWVVNLYIAPEGTDADGYFEGAGSGDSLTEAVNDALEQAGAIQLMSSDEREEYIGNLKFCVEDDMKYASRKVGFNLSDMEQKGSDAYDMFIEDESGDRLELQVTNWSNGWDWLLMDQDSNLIADGDGNTWPTAQEALDDFNDWCDFNVNGSKTAYAYIDARRFAENILRGTQAENMTWYDEYDNSSVNETVTFSKQLGEGWTAEGWVMKEGGSWSCRVDFYSPDGVFTDCRSQGDPTPVDCVAEALQFYILDDADMYDNGENPDWDQFFGILDNFTRTGARKAAGGGWEETSYGWTRDYDKYTCGDIHEFEGKFVWSLGYVAGENAKTIAEGVTESLESAQGQCDFHSRLASRKKANNVNDLVDEVCDKLLSHEMGMQDLEGFMEERFDDEDTCDKFFKLVMDEWKWRRESSRKTAWGSDDQYLYDMERKEHADWLTNGKRHYAPWHVGTCPLCGLGGVLVSDEYDICMLCAQNEWEGTANPRIGSKSAEQDYEVDIYNTLDGWDGWAEVYENADGVWGWEVSKYNDGSDYAGEYVDSNFAFDTPDEAFDDLWGQDRYIEAGRKVAFPSSLDDFDFDSTWDTYYYEDGSVSVYLVEVDDDAWWVDVEWPDGASVTNEQLGDECGSVEEAIAWARSAFESPVRGAAKTAYAYGSYDENSKWTCYEEGFEGEYDLAGLQAVYEEHVDKDEYPEFSDWEWDATRSGWLNRVAAKTALRDCITWLSEALEGDSQWWYGESESGKECAVELDYNGRELKFDLYYDGILIGDVYAHETGDGEVTNLDEAKEQLNVYAFEDIEGVKFDRDYWGRPIVGLRKKSSFGKNATRQFTYAEMKELEDEIEGTELHNADRFKDGGADYYAAL